MNTIKYFLRLRSFSFALLAFGLLLQSVAVALPPSRETRPNPPVHQRLTNSFFGVRAPLQQPHAHGLGQPANHTASATAEASVPSEVGTTEIVHTIDTPESIDALLNLIRNLRHPNLLKKLQIKINLDNYITAHFLSNTDVDLLRQRIIELFRRLSQAIQHLEILSLDVSDQVRAVDDNVLEAISLFLRANPRLQQLEIDFAHYEIKPNGAAHLAHALRTLSSLRSLSLKFVYTLCDDIAKILFTAFNALQNLEELVLSSHGRYLGGEDNSSLTPLVTAIQNLPRLTKVDLTFSRSMYTGDQILELVRILKAREIQPVIDLSNSLALQEKGIEIIAEIGDLSTCDWDDHDLPKDEEPSDSDENQSSEEEDFSSDHGSEIDT